jgi:phage I-like protein
MQKAAQFQPLTNRSSSGVARFTLPEDGFICLVPLGSAPIKRGNGASIIQLVDAEALAAMYNRAIEEGGEWMIDFEHFSHDPSKGTDAAAWVPKDAESLQNRNDGLYGKPRWSNDGDEAVTGGKLRFISPEFPDDDALLQNVSARTFRPLAVVGFGLTNRPNFRTTSKPLTNSGRLNLPDNNEPNKTMHKTLLALALGLTETELDGMDEPALKAKVQAMLDAKAAAEKAAADAVTLNNKQADDFIKTHAKVLTNADVSRVVRETFLTNRVAAEAIVAGMTPVADELTPEAKARAAQAVLHNRQNAQVPAAAEEAAEVLANKRSAYAHNLLANKSAPNWNAAWARAEAEVTA